MSDTLAQISIDDLPIAELDDEVLMLPQKFKELSEKEKTAGVSDFVFPFHQKW